MAGRKPKYPEIHAMQPGDVLRFPAEFYAGGDETTAWEKHSQAARNHVRHGGKGKRFSVMMLPGPIVRLERIA